MATPWNTGRVQVYTGDGKGKTTAALGQAVRALGAGLRVAIIYFDKGGTHYSERKILDEFKQKHPLEYIATGLDRIDPKTGKFRFSVLPDDIQEANQGLEAAQAFMKRKKNRPQVLILDEILNAVRLKMLPLEQVLKLVDDRPQSLELILTGRDLPKEIEARADLVTEMRLLKHYFYKGQKSREGIEW